MRRARVLDCDLAASDPDKLRLRPHTPDPTGQAFAGLCASPPTGRAGRRLAAGLRGLGR